ncbi:MAG: hypothetical protein OXR07_02530 [Nitrospira sp.]|nr:hypothetical protein [Nitrospira sp.]
MRKGFIGYLRLMVETIRRDGAGPLLPSKETVKVPPIRAAGN